ncbi:MAG: glycosyltransferase [Planctomycetota bacterium]
MHTVLVTHYFPPIGGPGARRMLGWVNGFVAAGHRVTVVTPAAHARDPYYQPAERYDGPANVVTPQILDPARLARGGGNASSSGVQAAATEKRGLAARLRPWLLLPDQRRLANGPLAREARRVIASLDEPTVLLTSSPYNSVHLAGAAVKRSLRDRVTWIADFRDDWFHPVFFPHPNAAYRAYNRRLERGVLRAADGLTVVSPKTLDRIRSRHDRSFEATFWRTEGAAKWRWMPNGFDPTGVEPLLDGLCDDRPIAQRDPSEPIRVLFSGTLWQNHKLDALVAALAAVAERHDRRFRFELAGRVIEPVPPSPDAARLEIVTAGWKPYEESLAQTRAADLLLVHTGPETQDIKIKLFDCAAVRRPVLVLGPIESATVRLARTHVADPLVAEQSDQATIEATLERFLASEALAGHAFAGLPDEYNRIKQASRLLDWASGLARPDATRTGAPAP